MAQMLIIADDLTGAADCGVACAGHGLRTIVVLGDSECDANADVLSVDGGTRRLSPLMAASETTRLLRKHLPNENTLLYKKLDSTLRGNVGAELAATLEARRAQARTQERIVVVLAPAFPATGRTTVNGRQLLHGKPLEETETNQNEPRFARSDIAAMLSEAHLRPALLGLHLVRHDLPHGESVALRTAMESMAQHADVLVCDAETDEDLHRIAEASMVLGCGTVWAGSAGLAAYLPLAARLASANVYTPEPPLVAGPALFVVGSGSTVSLGQVEVLASRSDTMVLRIPSEVLMAREQSPRWLEYMQTLEQALRAGSDVAVLPDPVSRLESSMGLQLSAALAAMVRPSADTVGALVATGGETARAIFDAWGIRRLQLIGEVEPGLPVSVTSGWRRELPVLTKAGGFGEPEALLCCHQFLHEHKRGDTAPTIQGKPARSKGLQ